MHTLVVVPFAFERILPDPYYASPEMKKLELRSSNSFTLINCPLPPKIWLSFIYICIRIYQCMCVHTYTHTHMHT